ncbi:uncharacterized protein M421DRAFT_427193, partial [Didymella exigua CBS 183.55]
MKLYNLLFTALLIPSVIGVSVAPKPKPGPLGPLPSWPGQSTKDPTPRFKAPPKTFQPPPPQSQPDPVYQLQRTQDPNQVVPDVFGNSLVSYSNLPESAQNKYYYIDLINEVNRWRLYTSVRLQTQKTYILQLNATNMPLGSNYTIQTVEYNTYYSPRYWQSAWYQYKAADDKTDHSTDHDVSALEVEDSLDASSSFTTSPSSTRSSSSTGASSSDTSSSDTHSAGVSAGPYIVTLAGALAIAILYAMMD